MSKNRRTDSVCFVLVSYRHFFGCFCELVKRFYANLANIEISE